MKEKIKDIYKSLKSTDTLFFLVLWMLIITHGTVLLIINVFFGIGGDNGLFWFGIQQVLWGGYFFLRMSYRHIKLVKTKEESGGNN